MNLMIHIRKLQIRNPFDICDKHHVLTSGAWHFQIDGTLQVWGRQSVYYIKSYTHSNFDRDTHKAVRYSQ